MKNKIIMMISAALLLTTLSAYAQIQAPNAKGQIMQQDSANLGKALEQEKIKQTANCPENDTVCVCGENKYCKDYILLLQNYNTPWEKIVKNTKNIKDFKTALYQKKYEMVNKIGTDKAIKAVLVLEVWQLKNALDLEKDTTKAITNYLADMPVTFDTLSSLEFITSVTAARKDTVKHPVSEQKAISQLMVAFKKATLCPADLNVNNYNLDKLCVINGTTAQIKLQGKGKLNRK